jgi:hypothetical protein
MAGGIGDAVDIGAAVAAGWVGAEVSVGELGCGGRGGEEGDNVLALFGVEHAGLERHEAVWRQGGGDPCCAERVEFIEFGRSLVAAIVAGGAEALVDGLSSCGFERWRGRRGRCGLMWRGCGRATGEAQRERGERYGSRASCVSPTSGAGRPGSIEGVLRSAVTLRRGRYLDYAMSVIVSRAICRMCATG